jgi:hypothetical protein
MKKLIAMGILVGAMMIATAHAALASVTCTQIGQFTYCNDSSGNHVVCNQIGQFTYCN